jgi:hypothetical protein
MKLFQYNLSNSISRLLGLPALIAGSLIILYSCGEEPNTLGRDLLPPIDDINLTIDSSTQIQAYTAEPKPIITAKSSSYVLGSLQNPVFGYYESSIVTQAELSTQLTLPIVRLIDSLTLQLRSSGYYGDSMDIQTLKVYEITSDLKTDSLYFSNTSIDGQYAATEIGSADFMAKDTLINVKITNDDFLYKFQSAGDSMFINNIKFQEVIKGLYLKVEPKTADGGSFTYINFQSDDSKMTLHYTIEDTAKRTYPMIFKNNVATFALFNKNIDGYPSNAHLNNPENQDTVLFLTSLAGLNVNLKFSDLEKWKEKGEISILKAELSIGVENSAFSWNNSKMYPPQLILFYLDETGSYRQISDYTINSSGFGGNYLANDNAYKFNIGHHLQSYIEGRISNFEFVIIPDKSSTTAGMVLLKSPLSQNSNRIKLKVIYTEL